jgi:hypothetical protein
VLIVIQSAAWMKWVRPLHRLRTAVRPDE